MKKSIFLLCLLLCFCTLPALAANTIDTIDITVELLDNGDALITQVWNGDFTEGTECYIVQDNMNGMTIENFSVSDENGSFEALSSWNVDASRPEKTRKSGVVNTSGGYELCWGIGEYGRNAYTVSYIMTNMVRGYDDYDGFNVRFVNDELSAPPSQASVRIIKNGTALTAENSGVWGFGYEGQAGFQEGTIAAYTESSMGSRNHMTIMVRLNKGIVSPTTTVGGSFDALKDAALKGSDYKLGFAYYLGIFWPFLLVLIPIGLSIAAAVRRRIAYNKAPFYRSVPQNGVLPASFWLSVHSKQCQDKNAIIGATLLKFIADGNLQVLTQEEEAYWGLSTKQTMALKLCRYPDTPYTYEQELYACLKASAGEDGILQEKELQKWCQTHYKRFMAVTDAAISEGMSLLHDLQAFEPGGAWFGSRKLSQTGKQELDNLYGFKKYLLEFSLIQEREAVEVGVWRDFLSYASLFGIADAVAKQFKHLYPAYFEEMDYDVTRAIIISNHMHRAAYLGSSRGYSAAQMRSSGGGGSSSFGGGGGFSGGGSGGGTR